MKYGESILVKENDIWICCLFVEQIGSKVKYRRMNGYGRPKTTTVDNVRDIYEGMGTEPKVKRGTEDKIRWKRY